MLHKAFCQWATTVWRSPFLVLLSAVLGAGLVSLSTPSAFAAELDPHTADSSGQAIDRVVAQNAPQIAPRFTLSAQRPLWPNAQVNYYYNPQDQPAGLSTADMEGLLRTAARKWENVCNVRFNYLGTTTVRPNLAATFETTDRLNVVGWELLTGSQAQFSGYVSWWYQNQGNAMIDADMFLNTSNGAQFVRNKPGLGALLTHEMGHMLAISHSNVQQSVMFAEPYHDLTYQATLRGDDAAACTTMYGPSTKANANRIFNWAEQSFTQFVSPVGSASQDQEGYHYRFYAASNSYIAERDGILYYLPVGGSVINLGTVTQFMAPATSAGF